MCRPLITAVGGMRIGRGNRSTPRKPAPVPLSPPQIPHDLGSNSGRRGGKPAKHLRQWILWAGAGNKWRSRNTGRITDYPEIVGFEVPTALVIYLLGHNAV
jgi:hypothetical protein